MDLASELAAAKPTHDAYVAKVRHWVALRDVKRKSQKEGPGSKSTRSTVQPKLIRRQNEWRYSALSEPFLSSADVFDVKPRTFEDVEAARQNDLVLNYQFRTKLNRVKFIDDLVRVTVDEGTSVVRTGWDRYTEIIEEEVPVWEYFRDDSSDWLNQLMQLIKFKAENPNHFKNLPTELQESVRYSQEVQIPARARQTGSVVMPQEKIIRNHPDLSILHYENVVIDPSCNGDISKAKFSVISFDTSYAELVEDGRYKNLDRVNWSSESPLTVPDHHSSISGGDFNFKDDFRKRVVAHEYWGWRDITGDKTKLTPVVCTWIGNTMVRMEENPYPDQKLPLVVIPYLPVKRELTGEPDAELLEDNQDILGAITRGMIDLMGRSANGQTGFAKGMLDPLNRRRYEQGQDYEFNPNMPPANGIHAHKYPEIPNSALTMLQLQNQDAEALSGVKAFAGGLSGEAFGDVASAIRGVLDASSKREMGILRRVAQGMQEIGAKIISMNQVFLSEEEVVRVTNKEFVVVRREDLAGQFDLIVDIATAEIDAAKAQDLSFMLQTIGNSIGIEMTILILAEIADLKRMPDLAQKLRNWQPTPDPIAEQMKQLELQKLHMEIQELQSKVQLNQAKAREAGSTADSKDLDFVEQQSGVSHAREMEKQGAQAQANQELEITKGIVNSETAPSRNPNLGAAINYNFITDALSGR